MLTITDFGCERHNRRQATLSGVEAAIMADVLYNLNNDGDFHTYICECGHTHRVGFSKPTEKLISLSAMFCKKTRRPVRAKLGPGKSEKVQRP
jgi:hypothetical protein